MNNLLPTHLMAKAIAELAGPGNVSITEKPEMVGGGYIAKWPSGAGEQACSFPQAWALDSLEGFKQKFAQEFMPQKLTPKHQWGFRFSYGFKWAEDLSREELLRVVSWYQSRHEEMRNELREMIDLARKIGDKPQ